MHSEAKGGFWPYIGADRAVSHILRGEPDKAIDIFTNDVVILSKPERNKEVNVTCALN